MIRNRNRTPDNHTPHRTRRIILLASHILRTEIRQQIDPHGRRQLRDIRPRPLRARIRLRRARQWSEALPEGQRRDGAGDGDGVVRLGRAGGLEAAVDIVEGLVGLGDVGDPGGGGDDGGASRDGAEEEEERHGRIGRGGVRYAEVMVIEEGKKKNPGFSFGGIIINLSATRPRSGSGSLGVRKQSSK